MKNPFLEMLVIITCAVLAENVSSKLYLDLIIFSTAAASIAYLVVREITQ